MSATTNNDEEEPICPACGGSLFVSRFGAYGLDWICHAGWCDQGTFSQRASDRAAEEVGR
jgi:hypothetical protein